MRIRHGFARRCLLWLVRWLFVAAPWWGATAWLARQSAPWAIELTSPACVAGLLWTYGGAWWAASSGARDRHRVVFRFLAVTTSLGICLVFLEVPAAVGWIDYGRVRTALTGNWDGPAEDFVNDHDFSFRRPPNGHWEGRPRSGMAQYFNLPIYAPSRQTFTTDSQGFRNPVSLRRADVALVGDSYVEGAYVSDDETVAIRLQELTGLTVANLGVSGYGSLQELKVLERYALPLEPRMVAWFFFEGNDLDDDQSFEDAMAYEHGVPAPSAPPLATRWREFVDRSFSRNAFLQLRATGDRVVPNNIDSFGWFRDSAGQNRRLYFFDFYATRTFGSYEEERFEVTKAAFRRGAAICREHGIQLVVFYVPIKFRVYGSLCTFPAGSPCPTWRPWQLEERFAAFVKEAGIAFVSLTAPMKQAAASGAVVYAPEDSHWSAAGHALAARQVASAWTSAQIKP
jgi:hypothetical protein